MIPVVDGRKKLRGEERRGVERRVVAQANRTLEVDGRQQTLTCQGVFLRSEFLQSISAFQE
jgi:hypothetical protein